MKRDGSCVDGPIAKIEPKAVTVRAQTGPAAIARQDLLQVSQNGSLVYSARSSWADVEAVHLRGPESFELKLHSGKLIKGSPLRVTADGFVFKKFLWLTTKYAKRQIGTVDYLRIKPDSEGSTTLRRPRRRCCSFIRRPMTGCGGWRDAFRCGFTMRCGRKTIRRSAVRHGR